MVTLSKVPKDHGFTLHFKLYLLWDFLSVVFQMQERKRKKDYSLCYTCFEMCPDVLPTMTCFDLPRGLWSLADPCLCGWDLSVAGCGKLIKCSEKDTIS